LQTSCWVVVMPGDHIPYKVTKDLSLSQRAAMHSPTPAMSPLFTETLAAHIASSQHTGISEAPILLSSITGASKALSTARPKRRKVKYARVQNFPLLHVFLEDSWQSWLHTRIPGRLLVHSWCIPGAFLVHSWCIPGAFLVHSWCIPGAFLVHSWCILS
jgi:hypothetical protein